MKRLWLFLVPLAFIVFMPSHAHAQGGNTVTIRYAGVPTGSCSPVSYAVNNATGAFYNCKAAAWNLVGGAGAGCAEGTCVVNAPTADQTITGAHALILSNENASIRIATTTPITLTGGNIDGVGDIEIGAPGTSSIGFYPGHFGNSGNGFNTAPDLFQTVINGAGGGPGVIEHDSGANIGFGPSSFKFGNGTYSTDGSGTIDASVATLASTGNSLGTQATTVGSLKTAANCSSSASPAVCAAAAAGSVAVPTGTNPTLVVNTTAVTANSQVFVQSDDSLGTKLGVTCNTTLANLAVEPVVSARTAATSFTITISGTVAVNPICLSYFIVN